MRPYFATSITAAANTASNNVLAVAGISNVKPIGTEFVVGATGTAAASMTDDSTTFLFTRLSAAVTGGTSITPAPLDAASAATACTSVHSSTGGTLAATGVHFGLNRRATFRWIAAPGMEFMPATGTAGGLVLRSVTAGAAYNVDSTILFQE